jgi:putative transposase
MIRTYRYRLYPTREQQATLNEILSLACWLYNRAIDYRRKRWKESRKSVTRREQEIMWSNWRNEDPENNPLRLVNMHAGQQVLRRLDSAYKQFFKGKFGFPRFKKSSRFNSINYKPWNGIHIRKNRLYIQSVGLIKVRWHRELPDGKIKNIIVLRKPSGWYALFQIDIPDQPIEKSTNPPVGIDVGISHALALSDGSFFDSPKYLQASLRKLRVLQRAVSRKQKGGQNWRKAMHKVARLYEYIANQRRDWWHKATRQLVDNYGIIVLENLPLSFMLQNKHLSRAAYDVGLGMFRTLLGYKSVKDGVEIVAVPPHNTSQECSGCGNIVLKDLSIRMHKCPDCGLTLDRDVNAALNILELGRSSWDVTWPVAASVSQQAPPL